MKEKIKSILIGILIGFIAFPAVTLSGTFVASLIQGKTAEEAVQILAQQIDFLLGKVEILEKGQIQLKSQQAKQELWQRKEEVCRYATELNSSIPSAPYEVDITLIDTAALSCDEYIQHPRWHKTYPRSAMIMGRSLDTIEKIYNWEKSCPEHPDLKVINQLMINIFKQRRNAMI